MTYYICVRHSKAIRLKQHQASGVHIADKPLPPLRFATVKSTSDLENYLIKLTISSAIIQPILYVNCEVTFTTVG